MVLLVISYFSTLVKLVNFTTLAKISDWPTYFVTHWLTHFVIGLHTSLHTGLHTS